MPINNPQVGEYYQTRGPGATQWVYIYAVDGPYVTVAGLGAHHAHTRMRKTKLRSIVEESSLHSNGLQMISGDILGLAGRATAEGVLYLEGTDDGE